MSITFSPHWQASGTRLRHTWAPLGNIDQFRWLGRADTLEQLKMARDELGVRHVRACAMYSPDLYVWAPALEDWRLPEGERRPPKPNWQLIDLSLEGLLNIGLKPVYTTCFTPVGMTDDPTVCWPDGNRTGMPRDLEQWKDFVSAGIQHHIDRYGRDEVRSWYFECWNEPNLKGCFFVIFIAKTMAEISQEADYFGYWCLSDIYNQTGLQSSEFQGHYGMLSLHGLRKPSWFAHQMLQGLGTEQVPVAGGDPLTGALATMGPEGCKVLIYTYPSVAEAGPVAETICVRLPDGCQSPTLYRLGAAENNIVAKWRELGAPPYPTPAQLKALRASNKLKSAPVAEIKRQANTITFTIERPGVALLEIGTSP